MADMVESELASVNAIVAAAPSDTPPPRPNAPQQQQQLQHQQKGQQQQQQQQQQESQPQSQDPQQQGTSDPRDAPEPTFPLLHNNAGADAESTASGNSAPSRVGGGRAGDDNDEDEPAVARPFHRTSSPEPASRPGLGKTVEDDDDDDGDARTTGSGPTRGPRPRLKHKMHRFSLYETASRFYIVGGDVTEKRYRILKIDRTNEDTAELSITDDKTVYTQKDMNQLLDTIDDGNKGTGGLKLRCTTWGLLGFIKFTGPYYMLLITKKSTVAMVGGHYVYQIDGTELIPLTSPSFKTDQRNTEESRFLGILSNLDLTRSFYYSYSYDITRTLQHNITRERTALLSGRTCSADDDLNSMFVWNNHLLQPAAKVLNAPFDWCRPIIHGYIDQAAVSVYGRTAHITIIARRSRYFAGARFLKRGANDLGYVANDVETEQIVSEAMTTSFHAPGPKFFANPTYTSYVQHRGSIPLYWTQDNTGVTPKPPIELNLVDPFYTAAALHFDNLFERYGAPVYVLNLIKARERTPRESKLLDEYTRAIAYLNQFLPADKKIIHRAWDMSRAAKSRDQDVIGTLETIAEDVMSTTGFFQNGDGHTTPIQTQDGVARTNCIDCLDRTNAAQFVIGKRALGHQLHALGILGDTSIEYDTDAVNLFTHMYHDHGDTIAVQYGGSQLVNTMETYRKINQWTSHSRDMIESFKRYYNNSFLDGQRQEAYNLFLGNYIFAQGQPMLWDLATDYYLHHEDPRTWLEKRKRDYINWYTPKFLEPRVLPPYPAVKPASANSKPISAYDDYWLEYYRPSTLSSFPKMFPYKMNSTIKYIPFKSTLDGRYDLSPFRVRTETDSDMHDRKKAKKEVTIVAPQDLARIADDTETSSVGEKPPTPTIPSGSGGSRGMSLHRWLHEKQHAANGSAHTHRRHISIEEPSSSQYSYNNNNSADDSGTPLLSHPPHAHHSNHHPHQSHHHQQHQQHHHSNHNNHTTTTTHNNHSHSPSHNTHPTQTAAHNDNNKDTTTKKPHQTALEKSRAAQWTFAQVVHDSLNPSVSAREAADYARYVAHPHHLPLVVSSEMGPAEAAEVEVEYVRYVGGRWREEGLGLLSASGVSAGVGAGWGNESGQQQQQQHRGHHLHQGVDADKNGVAHHPHQNHHQQHHQHNHHQTYHQHHQHHGSSGSGGEPGELLLPQEDGGDLALYLETVHVAENPLTVTEEDAQKKRYKAYRKWLRGKSLFKQQPVD